MKCSLKDPPLGQNSSHVFKHFLQSLCYQMYHMMGARTFIIFHSNVYSVAVVKSTGFQLYMVGNTILIDHSLA